MEFFKKKTQFDFMKNKHYALFFSAILFIVSISGMAIKGFNLGLDFTGGTQIKVHYAQPIPLETIRTTLHKAGFSHASVQSYGSASEVMVRISSQWETNKTAIQNKLTEALKPGAIQSLSYIGPQVGKALMINGVVAVIISMLATMVYIALRFELRFAFSATISLIHDPILILGIFAWAQMEFNLIALAALLTILGYSLNDTIVVYDRVREEFNRRTDETPENVVNLSINQTLSRTIMTSSLTLVVVLALYLFGGDSLEGFSLALIIGIVIGTYSSIYIAGALAVMMGLNRDALIKKKRGPVDDLP
jgi:preprotein translocase subunit SecF